MNVYLVVFSDNTVGGILNWWISLLYGEKPMLVVQIDQYWRKLIWQSLRNHQTAKLKLLSIFLLILRMASYLP